MASKVVLYFLITIFFVFLVLSQPDTHQSPGQIGDFGGAFSQQSDVQNTINNDGNAQGTVPTGTSVSCSVASGSG
jgi:hypothetical protein